MAAHLVTSPASPPSYRNEMQYLPPPPCERNTPREISQVHQAFAQYYWPRHFESSQCDPASFFDRIMTDYARVDGDPVGEWLVNMSPIYKVYKACLKYGVENGTPKKALEAKRYQGVPTNPLQSS